ncbi:hypothetical protein [Massilia consociata]|uniref:Uncharacterized protein n=1 Tax=Massilia consociata TaxID=760117 RepID=A0ABV6FFB5_9BURK
MKLRPASLHLPIPFQRPLRFGRRWRGHELPLRIIQLAMIVVLAWFGTKLIVQAVTLATRAFAGLVS